MARHSTVKCNGSAGYVASRDVGFTFGTENLSFSVSACQCTWGATSVSMFSLLLYLYYETPTRFAFMCCAGYVGEALSVVITGIRAMFVRPNCFAVAFFREERLFRLLKPCHAR